MMKKTALLIALATAQLQGAAMAADAAPQTQAIGMTVIAGLDPVTAVYRDTGITAGSMPDGTKIGEYTVTKTTTTQASPIAVRWTTATGGSPDEWRHELTGTTPANKMKVLLDDAKSLGTDRWLDHTTPNLAASTSKFDIKIDGDQTIVADTYSVSLDAASYAP